MLPIFSTVDLTMCYITNNANKQTFKEAHFDCNCTCVQNLHTSCVHFKLCMCIQFSSYRSINYCTHDQHENHIKNQHKMQTAEIKENLYIIHIMVAT